MLVLGERFLAWLEDVIGRRHASIGKYVPGHALGELGQFKAVHLPVHVHSHVDEVVGHTVGRSVLSVEHERYRQIVVAAFGLPGPHPVPGEVGVTEPQIVLVTEVLVVAKHLVLTAEMDDLLEVAEDVGVLLEIVPVEPGDFVVLTIGIVIALLGIAYLVAGQHHRDALAHHQHRDGVLHLPVAQTVDIGIICLPLPAAVPAVIVVLAVAVVFAVGFVVLTVIRHEVHHREAVVRRDEVDAGLDTPTLRGVEVGRADDALLHIAQYPFVALQESAHAVAELSVPLCPAPP